MTESCLTASPTGWAMTIVKLKDKKKRKEVREGKGREGKNPEDF